MSKDGAAGLLLLFLLFILEPILLGICAQKAYDRAGAFWGILAFGMNMGILVFFEGHRVSSSLVDAATQVGTVMSLSAISILSFFEATRNGPGTTAEQKSPINLRRG